ncbi:MAG: glycoside hydrolase family 2 TIM barrel-domain containing protein, partial [Eubacteriales bacterium]|nr:glycoside hydrolase family 2 TIM barrel-domain containing protein [Eubacteriales bacterium]
VMLSISVRGPEQYTESEEEKRNLPQDGPVIARLTRIRLSELSPAEHSGTDSGTWICCRLRLTEPLPWSPESPFLYAVRITLGRDEVSGYFAMRSFGTGRDEAGRPCLTLNGKPYFFHGVLDQGYWPESLMTAPADEAFVHDILRMKELGFNMLRKHAKNEPLRWYYHCDRLGMAVWQDMVNGGGPINAMLCTYAPTVVPAVGKIVPDRMHHLLSRTDAKERERFKRQLLEMVEVLGNAPCIGMWVIFNEGWGQFDAARLTEAVRQADPSRPIDHASGWFEQGAGDVLSEHNYFRELAVKKDRYGRAFVLSEYGGITCVAAGHISCEDTYGYHAETPQGFGAKFRAVMEEVRGLRGRGLAGAVYTQLSDIEEEVNGLLTYDRKINKLTDL